MEDIPGLHFITNFITLEEEKELLKQINKQVWSSALSRRTQHYGYIYDYKSREAVQETNPIPEWCQFLITRLMEKELLKNVPDQLIINEYMPGQGIFPHIDDPVSFEDGIVSLSLESDIIMDFIRDTKKHVMLKRRSVIVLHGDARYKWKHGITARKSDFGLKRSRRVSLTFRKMKI